MFRHLPHRMRRHQEKREEQLLRQRHLPQGTMRERVLQPERPRRTSRGLLQVGQRREEAQRVALPAQEGLVTGLAICRKAWRMRTIHLTNQHNE